MSFWLVAVPQNGAGQPSALSQLQAATHGVAATHAFDLPGLKVGTLDQLMALSEDTLKMDTFVGGVAKKIEKTYYEMWKTEAAEANASKDAASAAAGRSGAASSSSAAGRSEEKAPELRIGDQNKTAHEFVSNDWKWNDVRYPRRSPLRLLAELIMKDASKSDEALKKQVAEFNEVRTSYTTIERKDQGTLLVKPIGAFVKQQPIETAHLTTLMLVVPLVRKEEFLSSYETLEAAAAVREAEEAQKKALELAERARKDAERRNLAEEKDAAPDSHSHAKTAAQQAHEAERAKEKLLEAEKAAEAKKLEAEMVDPAQRAAKEAAERERAEEEKRKNKKLPKGCNAVVPRSHTILESDNEYMLVSVVVLRQGAEQYKNLCREKRYVVRPFKFDPAEDLAERERKTQLASKKKSLFNFLMRWCTTTYTEVFSAWIHLKAIRLYVETVLRYGLPFQSQAAILEPARGREKQARDVLKQLYGRLAGGNAALTAALDPNEPDLSGLGTDFYPYVYLPLNLGD